MTDKLQYLLYLNVSLIEAEHSYQKAKNSPNPAYKQSALFNLQCKKDALKSYVKQLIREGIQPSKTLNNPELFDAG